MKKKKGIIWVGGILLAAHLAGEFGIVFIGIIGIFLLGGRCGRGSSTSMITVGLTTWTTAAALQWIVLVAMVVVVISWTLRGCCCIGISGAIIGVGACIVIIVMMLTIGIASIRMYASMTMQSSFWWKALQKCHFNRNTILKNMFLVRIKLYGAIF